MYRVLSEVIVT